ncbi:zinc ribbon domain-containing protein, partial [Desulfobacter latus]|nr:transposase [Desulfobacter latus]
DRTFICPACGFKLDRDENAARNLEQYPVLSAA